MNRIQTWAEFKADLKEELGIQSVDTSNDNFLLALANEGLIQMTQSGKDLREFRLDVTLAITGTANLNITNLAICNIDQVYYQYWNVGVLQYRWNLSEATDVVGPAPIETKPNAYTVAGNANDATNMAYVFTFYPIASAGIGDKLQIVGTGFKLIGDDSTQMYYFQLYPWLKNFVAERYRMHQNNSIERVTTTGAMANRAGSLVTQSESPNTNGK